jgi:hypothetical protein
VKKRIWTENQLRETVANSKSTRQVLIKLGLKEAGGNYSQIKKYFNLYQINTSHFTGQAWNKGLTGIGKPIIPLERILTDNYEFQSYKLKKRLFDAGIKNVSCEICGWAKQAKNGRIPLELDHINGNRRDNRLENLRILCPNCHSLQSTHRGLNRKLKLA